MNTKAPPLISPVRLRPEPPLSEPATVKEAYAIIAESGKQDGKQNLEDFADDRRSDLRIKAGADGLSWEEAMELLHLEIAHRAAADASHDTETESYRFPQRGSRHDD